MRRARAVAARLAGGLLVVLGASFVVFSAMNWLPGDPARRRLAPTATAEQIQAERHRLGLDAPVLVRYGRWLEHAAHGDLGTSWTSGRPVAAMLGQALGNSAWLIGLTLVVCVPLAVALALACGLRPGGALDRVALAVGVVGLAVPSFVVGGLALLLLSVELGWLPALSSPEPGRPPIAQPQILILPVVVLGLSTVGYLLQILRAQVAVIGASDYVEAARLRGLAPRRLLARHVVPGLMATIGQLVALTIITMATETVVVETVFSYPGVGLLLQSSAGAGDQPVVQGIALVLAIVIVALSGASALATRHYASRS